MEKREHTHLMLLLLAALVIVSANAAVWLAARQGIIPTIENIVLWGAFAAFSTLCTLWATRLLGLQPVLVALSYVAGGLLASLGVRGVESIGIAEAVVAGGAFGAFGSLGVGNVVVRERSAGYCRSHAALVFVLLGLLVLDGILISRVWQAGATAIINGLALPLVVVGGVCGCLWLALNRLKIEPVSMTTLPEEPEGEASEEIERADPAARITLEMPEEAEEEPVELAMPLPTVLPDLAIPVCDPDPEPEAEAGEFLPLELDAVEE